MNQVQQLFHYLATMIANTGPTTVYIGPPGHFTVVQYTTDSTDSTVTTTSTSDILDVQYTVREEKTVPSIEYLWEEKWLNTISTLSILHALKQKTPPLKQWFYKVIRQPKPKSGLKARLYK